ncbi:hypothetical protein D4764_0122220 [Takifugu flavidus]|uniref:Alkylated DNA repair protein AlkB homologue 8 N-terminal domain-containing protein n=1 Tax=Takifugu flavidus TaxID=433684 RepID=A0A5C6MJ11_9TELE|nr:hypothetical protein D4764_0122220 [Takifugu flavidus]
MYSHTGRNKQCERKTNTCFYSFSMKNLNTSQTGTYIDIERYASSVLDYISTSIDSVTTQKQITITARANLKRGIKKAKHDYKLKVEGHFSNSNPRSMWQGIQVISNYKPINPSPPSTDISFLNELNNFYARFEKDNQEQASKDLTWTTNCSSLVKTAHQRLFFLRTLKKHHLSSDILVNFYRCSIESILTSCVTVWYGNCSASDRKALQKVVKTAQRIAGASLPSIEDIYRRRCHRRAKKVTKDSCHPAHGLFTLMPSGRRYRSLRTKTTRYKCSIYQFKKDQSSLHSAQNLEQDDICKVDLLADMFGEI